MYILGINAYHGDSSACIYKDGQLIAASEEERFRRIKHWAGFPTEAINFCLKEAGISIKDVDHIAISRDPKANLGKKAMTALKNRLKLSNILDRVKNLKKAASIEDEFLQHFNLQAGELKAKIHNVEHHRSHLASAFFASPFEKSALLSIDGFGDFTSTMTGIGKGNKIEVMETVSYPHSIGVFYTTFTQWLGFPHYGDEYKVMGLAPYGEPKYLDQLRKVIKFKDNGLFELELKYFNHPTKGVNMAWEGGIPAMDSLYSEALLSELGPARKAEEPLEQSHRDWATSIQRITEEVIYHMLTHLQQKTGLDSVCIAGGVAQNSVANGKIILKTPFKKVYIPPAGHDAGTCIGAALWVYNQLLDQPRTEPMLHGYLGSRFSNQNIEALLKEKNISYTKLEGDALFDKVTSCLINSGVVGWFQGRAEFGPRALGHRSIIADPRRNDAKEILNAKIKRRESFRPFAPSILKQHIPDYFEQVDDVPFMEKVFLIKEDQRAKIPAVTHVDGTGRLQSVDETIEPKYFGLINNFYSKTGVPILLNTSFNENEPIVNTPEEALNCFLRTKMDMLVLEDIVIER
ncbi:MAG: carbamoyltransferase C-terminal domain-containing protein [Pedobacter sp.]|uniref:carbamoyltransferase family protein n=1 Tax=Pedobacter sp. TaxID=1411316 RepID=UPI0028094300|nr:carbamoyltransferase C-terminal domain-containing protein [Pedobacter sp.]MDQ8004893.1 carbamoyltransferase C-terminal domain-containing protein [Pedobacter sp.]